MATDAKQRTSLTQFDEYPEAMLVYMRHYGPHFNKKLCDFAVSKMYKVKNGMKERVATLTKDQVKAMLIAHNVKIENDQLYDSTYVANMCKADFYGSSIEDDKHLVRYIKDVIDDPDAYDGIVFNRWYADMSYTGIAVDWEDML